MYDLIIVGAGPSGLTSALYARRANKKVLVLEAKTYGGQIVNANLIENYPGIPRISGFEYATNLYNQVKDLGAEIKFETVIRIEKDKSIVTNKATYKAKAIIIATGAENRKLNIDKETNLIEDAIYLSNIASKVYLIHRRNSFRGEIAYSNELIDKSNVEFIFNSNIVKLNGKDLLESIDVEDNQGNIATIDVNGLFIAVGQIPKNEIFANLIELDQSGYIKSKDGVHTNEKGIYVAGDTRVKDLRQLTTAVSDGAIAATVAIKEMEGNI